MGNDKNEGLEEIVEKKVSLFKKLLTPHPFGIIQGIVAAVLFMALAGNISSGNIGGFSWALNIDTRLTKMENEIASLKKQLSVAAVYDMQTLSSEQAFFDDQAKSLHASTKAQVVTIYAINYDTGKRKVIGMWPPEKRVNMLEKEKRLWTEGYKPDEAILKNTSISVVERLPFVSESALNDWHYSRPFYIYNHSDILTDPIGMADNHWDKTLGNQVTYTAARLGIRPMVYIAIDYNAQNADEVRQNMRNSLLYASDTAQIAVDKIIEKNPALSELEWLFK